MGEVAANAVDPVLVGAVTTIDIDRGVELFDRGATICPGQQRVAPALKRLSLLPHHPKASKGFGRLDELCFGFAPRASCGSDDCFCPRDEADKSAAVLS